MLVTTLGLAACQASDPGPNRAPWAEAGPDRTGAAGQAVLLDGRGSHDPDGDALDYLWEFLALPPGAGADLAQGVLAGLEESQARLIPDRPGLWLVALTVSDGHLTSDRDVLHLRVRQACQTDADCPDPNDCTAGRCQDGTCRNEALPDGTGCDDGLRCTGPDACLAGACRGHPLDCSALDAPCQRGACQEETGTCQAEPLPDGTACDDGFFCTDPDSCQSGLCHGPARDCGPPAQACRVLVCDEGAGACLEQQLVDGAPCDDGLYCTVGDACLGGACLGAPRDCGAAGGGCLDGVCDEAEDRCTGDPLPDGLACDDGDPCTRFDACLAGACVGSLLDCSGLDGPCALGVCDPESGDCVPAPLEDGLTCDDGRFCTVGDTCQSGVCAGQARDCSGAAQGFCQLGRCDEGLGRCVADPAHESQPCDDLFCTDQDACRSGVCDPGPPRVCPDRLDGCAHGVCDEQADTCALEPVLDTTPCDDGDGCTQGDACLDGVCTGTPLVCPLGCDPQAGRCRALAPSNVSQADLCRPDALPLPITGGTVLSLNTETGSLGGAAWTHFRLQDQAAGQPRLAIFSFSSFDLPEGLELRVQGTNALVLAACGDASVHGLIVARGVHANGGPGGYPGGPEEAAGQGPGGGGPGVYQSADPYNTSGGGGGGHGQPGGQGGNTPNRAGGAGGGESTTPELRPLVGGSGGGGGGGYQTNDGGPGGGGGGAVQLAAGGTLIIGPTGGIDVAGAGGRPGNPTWGGGGGGGAGGAILLEGAQVVVAGRLTANGGGGGGADTSYFSSTHAPGPGDDGHQADEAAPGGAPCGNVHAGPGGSGGYGGLLTGFGLQPISARVTGGGGGGVGRIRINSFENGQTELSNDAVLSPHCDPGGRCTLGAIDLW
jgi:hypothetical protein